MKLGVQGKTSAPDQSMTLGHLVNSEWLRTLIRFNMHGCRHNFQSGEGGGLFLLLYLEP